MHSLRALGTEDSSRGLVEMTQAYSPTAQFIHESVREYLLQDGLVNMDHSLGPNVSALSNAKMARSCQTYLELDLVAHIETRFDDNYKDDQHIFIWSDSDFSDSEELLTARRMKYPFIHYVVDHTFDHLGIAHKGGSLELTSLRDFPILAWNKLSSAYVWQILPRLHDAASLVSLLVIQRAETFAEAVLAVSSTPSHTASGFGGPANVVAAPKDGQLFHYDPNESYEG